MKTFTSEDNVCALRKEIDLINNQIFQQVSLTEMHGLDTLLDHKLNLIQVLLTYVHAADVDKIKLMHYLHELQDRDEIIMQKIIATKSEMAQTILNLNKMSAYTR